MANIPPLHSAPTPPPEQSVKKPESTQNQQITQLASKTLHAIQKTTRKGALFVAKCIAIPIECTLLAGAMTALAISVLASLPLRLVVNSKASLTPFHHLASLVDAIWEVIKITYHIGTFPKSERLQPVDNLPSSPQFALISPTTRSNAPPILYAPGYLDSPDSLRDTCRKIADDSGAPVYIIKYRALFQPIEEHAKDIARLEERIFKDTGTKDVILIGHSMGGINTGRFIQQLNPDQVNVKLWITLASPLEGTPLAKYGYGKCSQDMKPDSHLIEKLQNEGTIDKIPSLHIYTLTDGVVPSESATGPIGALHTAYQCRQAYSHLGMRSRPEVFKQIQNAIKQVI